MPTEKLQSCLPGEKRIAICFEHVGNQWIEQWQVGVEPAQKLLLESASTSDSDWPQNPPWQEVIKELHDGLPVIMAIGRAGRSHWSAAWKVLPTGVIHVEYACRVQTQPGFLGTTFRLARGATYSKGDDSALSLQIDNCSFQIMAGNETSIRVNNEGLISIRPIDVGNDSLPRTLQWQYRIT